jgi:hypothetical protein
MVSKIINIYMSKIFVLVQNLLQVQVYRSYKSGHVTIMKITCQKSESFTICIGVRLAYCVVEVI